MEVYNGTTTLGKDMTISYKNKCESTLRTGTLTPTFIQEIKVHFKDLNNYVHSIFFQNTPQTGNNLVFINRGTDKLDFVPFIPYSE